MASENSPEVTAFSDLANRSLRSLGPDLNNHLSYLLGDPQDPQTFPHHSKVAVLKVLCPHRDPPEHKWYFLYFSSKQWAGSRDLPRSVGKPDDAGFLPQVPVTSMAAASICRSAELSGSSGSIRGTWSRGRLLELDPVWAANGFAWYDTQESTWVDHMQSEGHMTVTGITWNFRGGRYATW